MGRREDRVSAEREERRRTKRGCACASRVLSLLSTRPGPRSRRCQPRRIRHQADADDRSCSRVRGMRRGAAWATPLQPRSALGETRTDSRPSLIGEAETLKVAAPWRLPASFPTRERLADEVSQAHVGVGWAIGAPPPSQGRRPRHTGAVRALNADALACGACRPPRVPRTFHALPHPRHPTTHLSSSGFGRKPEELGTAVRALEREVVAVGERRSLKSPHVQERKETRRRVFLLLRASVLDALMRPLSAGEGPGGVCVSCGACGRRAGQEK